MWCSVGKISGSVDRWPRSTICGARGREGDRVGSPVTGVQPLREIAAGASSPRGVRAGTESEDRCREYSRLGRASA